MKKLCYPVIAATILSCLTTAAWGPAADQTSFNGGICKGYATGASTWSHDVTGVKGVSGGIALCPLIRNNTGSAAQIQAAYVEGKNENTTTRYQCAMYTLTEDMGGSTLDSHTLSSTSAGKLQLGPFSPETSAGNEGAYSMVCSLDPGDWVYNILVKELES